jgi:hypothetical protein
MWADALSLYSTAAGLDAGEAENFAFSATLKIRNPYQAPTVTAL